MALRSRNFETVLRRQYREVIKQDQKLPKIMGTVALRHFKRAMQREGFVDQRLSRWPEVQRRIPGHPNFKPKRQQKILVGPGSGGIINTLRIKEANSRRVVIASMGKEYALYHNKGEGKLPQRKFLGNSTKLEREVGRIIKKRFDKALS